MLKNTTEERAMETYSITTWGRNLTTKTVEVEAASHEDARAVAIAQGMDPRDILDVARWSTGLFLPTA